MFPFPPKSIRILRWKDLLEKETIILKSLGFQERKQTSIKVEKLIPKHRKMTCILPVGEAEGSKVVGPRVRDCWEGRQKCAELTQIKFSLPQCRARCRREKGQNLRSRKSLQACVLVTRGAAVPSGC